MAKLDSPFSFQGPLGALSFYKRKDLDGVIVRSKGGASRKKVANSPSMEGTRRMNAEFAGRSATVKFLRLAMQPMWALANTNFTPLLNRLLVPVQAMDTEHAPGQRSVCLSKATGLLEGFRLNQKNCFDDILRSPVRVQFNTISRVVEITIPALVPGANFMPPAAVYHTFQLVACMGRVPDMLFSNGQWLPAIAGNYPELAQAETDWQPITGSPQPQMIQLLLVGEMAPEIAANSSLVVSLGIRFAKPAAATGVPNPMAAGAANVVAVFTGEDPSTRSG